MMKRLAIVAALGVTACAAQLPSIPEQEASALKIAVTHCRSEGKVYQQSAFEVTGDGVVWLHGFCLAGPDLADQAISECTTLHDGPGHPGYDLCVQRTYALLSAGAQPVVARAPTSHRN